MTVYSPRICYQNYISSDDITVSSNTDSKDKLIDRNSERRWVAVGEGEAGTITIALTQEIDTIVLLNTNALTFTVKYDTSTDFNPVVSQANATQEAVNITDSSNSYLIDNRNREIP